MKKKKNGNSYASPKRYTAQNLHEKKPRIFITSKTLWLKATWSPLPRKTGDISRSIKAVCLFSKSISELKKKSLPFFFNISLFSLKQIKGIDLCGMFFTTKEGRGINDAQAEVMIYRRGSLDSREDGRFDALARWLVLLLLTRIICVSFQRERMFLLQIRLVRLATGVRPAG